MPLFKGISEIAIRKQEIIIRKQSFIKSCDQVVNSIKRNFAAAFWFSQIIKDWGLKAFVNGKLLIKNDQFYFFIFARTLIRVSFSSFSRSFSHWSWYNVFQIKELLAKAPEGNITIPFLPTSPCKKGSGNMIFFGPASRIANVDVDMSIYLEFPLSFLKFLYHSKFLNFLIFWSSRLVDSLGRIWNLIISKVEEFQPE